MKLTSKPSKRSSNRKPSRRPSASGLVSIDTPRRGPLPERIARRAREIAATYTAYVAPNELSEGRVYLARVLELPGAFANAKTPDEAMRKLQSVLETLIGSMLEKGLEPPEPGSVNRNVQVNVRLTRGEKLRFEQAAQRQGFRSISDFLRAAALREAS